MFLECVRSQLSPGAVMAVALAEELDCFETVEGAPGPLPDVAEIDSIVYSSRPVAVRADGDGFALERRRETVSAAGRLTIERNLIHLDGLGPGRSSTRPPRPACDPSIASRSPRPRTTSARRW